MDGIVVVLTPKDAVVAFAGTATEAGTVRAAAFAARVTTTPREVAGLERVTMQ